MAKAGRVQHWKHGWIPISPEAKAFVEGHGPDPTPGSGRKALPSAPTAPRKAHLALRGYDDLSPSLQGKINKKLESQTGLPEPELAKRVQENLRKTFEAADKSQADWYAVQKADIEAKASELGLTPDQFTGMISVTSAKKRWKENVDFAQSVGQKLAADQPFSVTPDMIHDYNTWAAKRRGGADGLAKPHLDLKPGVYRPSELPADFAASKTPDMPKTMNTDATIAAVAIAKGTVTPDDAIGGPKQRSFVNNLTDPTDDRYVTVDTWHYKAMMGDIPITRTIGPKGDKKTFSYTLDQWSDRELARTDGRADMYGYDHSKPVKADDNLDKIKKAADAWSPQAFFQAGPESKADGYDGKNGTYPWFVKQTQIVADQLGVSPNALQAVVWYAVGGGA